MPSTIIVLGEQQTPSIFMLPSFTVYSIAAGVFVVVLHWLYHNKPTVKRPELPVEQPTRESRSSSVSSEATLVEVAPVDAPKSKDDEAKEKDTPVESPPKSNEKPASKSSEYFSQQSPLTTIGLSVKGAVAKGRPAFERRVSLPARRLSSHVVSALHHLSPHHHHAADSPQDANTKTPEQQQPKVAEGDAPQDANTKQSEQQQTKVAEGAAKVDPTPSPAKKPAGFRQVVRRASVAFGISHRS